MLIKCYFSGVDKTSNCNQNGYCMATNSRFAMATHIMLSTSLKPNELVTSSYLAKSLNTNPVVVRRILSDLQKAGLLHTQTGRSGGARLAKAASSISLKDIFMAVDDGELFAYNPNDPNKTCALSCEMKMILEPVFESAQNSLLVNLGKVRLADLQERLSKKCSKE